MEIETEILVLQAFYLSIRHINGQLCRVFQMQKIKKKKTEKKKKKKKREKDIKENKKVCKVEKILIYTMKERNTIKNREAVK